MSQSSCHLLYFYFSFCTRSIFLLIFSYLSSPQCTVYRLAKGPGKGEIGRQPLMLSHFFLIVLSFHSITPSFSFMQDLDSCPRRESCSSDWDKYWSCPLPWRILWTILAGKKTDDSTLYLRVTSGSCVNLLPLFFLGKFSKTLLPHSQAKFKKWFVIFSWSHDCSKKVRVRVILSYNLTLQF